MSRSSAASLIGNMKLQNNRLDSQIDAWIESGDLESKQTLFTIQEQEFMDYMLNVQKYDNGPELRNKYAHGIFPADIQKQEQDYIELLCIMILIIIKINEEFCVMNSRVDSSASGFSNAF